jgi:2-methylcitrate dehydratase PrpD
MTSSAAQPAGFDHLTGLTRAAIDYLQNSSFAAMDPEHLRLARRCVLDGLAVSLGGSEQHGMEPLRRYIEKRNDRGDARLFGVKGVRTSAPLAALWLGTAGHAMDWDDTQLAEGPGRPYGLLMHPTMPPLAAGLAVSQLVARETGTAVGGAAFLAAFAAGFEVGCKIAEAINPNHYMRGCHTSGTIGVFAAASTAAKLLGLGADETANALGLAASMSAGIRVNFGTMTKPFHVGRAAENGVTAALLAREGFTANTEALDGRWGFLAVAGPGGEPELVRDRFGSPPTMVSPGISIKPYPSGVLTHPSMDALAFLMQDEGILAEDVAEITLSAGSNVLGPIRFERAMSELEGKFSFQFLLSAIALRGRAGKAEFTNEFVRSAECQAMQGRIRTQFDQQIEDRGWDRIRSRIDLVTRDGRRLQRWADEDYRGSPHKPLSDAQLEEKFLN